MKLLEVPRYSQSDPRWAMDRMGESFFTLSEKGCNVTITAAGLTYLGWQVDPKEYNRLASAQGGYLITVEKGKKYANLYWRFPDTLTDEHIVRKEYRTFPRGTLWGNAAEAILQNSRPVWSEVKYNGMQHWVLLVGKIGTDFWILDPIDGQVKVMNYPYVYRLVSYIKN